MDSKLLGIRKETQVSQNLFNDLQSIGRLVSYVAGELIHRRGDETQGISILKSGRVRVGNYDESGRYFLAQVLSEYETFGEITVFTNFPRSHTVEALIDCEILQVSRHRLLRYIDRNPELKDFFLQSLARKLHYCTAIIDDVRRLSLPKRLGKWLLDQNISQGSNVLDIKQSDLADAIGASLLSVNKGIKQLSARGLIKADYGRISIMDPVGLKAFIG